MPGVSRGEIVGIDADGQAVYDLVMEVTLQERDGEREPKSEFLRRIMETGSQRAKMLKLADRLSNLIALGFVHDDQFVRDVLTETRQFILPYAEKINPNMYREMYDLVADREAKLALRNGKPPAELSTPKEKMA
jgi:(p)ppGpp synthase/HD superfamily hydrolase